jgi:hypothetical protein
VGAGLSKPVVLAILAAIPLVAGCGTADRGRPPTAAIPRQLLAESRPIGRGPMFHPPATGPVIGHCRPRLGPRFGIHLELFAGNRVVIVPAGIGTRPPRLESGGRIVAARCYGSLVTLEPTGLVLVRPGPGLTLSDAFRAWGQPLSSQMAAFVGGRRRRGNPGTIRLVKHVEIVVESGPYVPPHALYTFPPGS